jgi:hypothetical protein
MNVWSGWGNERPKCTLLWLPIRQTLPSLRRVSRPITSGRCILRCGNCCAIVLASWKTPSVNWIPSIQEFAKKVLALEDIILESFSEVYQVKMIAIKTRIHGDYHLGQVLFTGKDFVIIDFEGEPGFSFQRTKTQEKSVQGCSWYDAVVPLRSIWQIIAE